MNQVALVGNVTDDPELRYTQSGAALARSTVAVSHRSKHNGEWQDVNVGFPLHGMAIGRRERSAHAEEGHAGPRGRHARSAQLAGQRRQLASGRGDPGHPRGTGSSVRYRRGSQVDRRGSEVAPRTVLGSVLGGGEAGARRATSAMKDAV